MDIVNLLKSSVNQLENGDCGLCFNLVLGGRTDFFNNERTRTPANTYEEPSECELCCVDVGMFKCKSRDIYNNSDAGSYLEAREWDIQLFFGIPSRLDIQFYNEIDKDAVNESKWVKYLFPLQCCLNKVSLNLCDIYDSCGCGCGTTLEIRSWNSDMKIDYLDKNFDGWLIDTTVREWISR